MSSILEAMRALALAVGLSVLAVGCVMGPPEDDPTDPALEQEAGPETMDPWSESTEEGTEEGSAYQPGAANPQRGKADESSEEGGHNIAGPTPEELEGDPEAGAETQSDEEQGGDGVSHGSPQPLDPHKTPSDETKDPDSSEDDEED